MLLAASSVGCGYATLEARYVPNPVLLGPVDRVGGHRAGGEKTVAPIRREVGDFLAVATQTSQVGGTVTTRTEGTAFSNDAAAITHDILTATEGRSDRDVRVDTIDAGGYAMIHFSGAVTNRWVGLEGRVVEVGHGR